MSGNEVIGNLFPETVQSLDESIKTLDPTGGNSFHPITDFCGSLGIAVILLQGIGKSRIRRHISVVSVTFGGWICQSSQASRRFPMSPSVTS
jgi:hypothetical protein